MDTDVVVAAMRSPSGASAELLRRIDRGDCQLLLSVPMLFEYEEVCHRAVHKTAAGLSSGEVSVFLDGLVDMAEPVEAHLTWRPQLRDPDDEMVLEVAVNGQADMIVTFNTKDFGSAPERFGIVALLPRDALKRISA